MNSTTAVSAFRVGFDVQLAVGTATGIGEYAVGCARALRAENVDVVDLSARWLDPWRFDRRVLWDQVVLPSLAARARVDLLHCASGTMPLVVGRPVVVTVHDVAWHRVQGHTRPYARGYFGRFAAMRYRTAAHVFVDSRFSRDELLDVVRIDASRVAVAYPGVSADYATVVRRRENESPYILAVGTVEPRKNLAVLVRALVALPTLRLVSVGPPTPYLADCRRLAADLGVDARFEVRGYVPRSELLGLYAGALAAAVPSRYEGFGYAAAQARCAGVPLIVADTSSLPEVAGPTARRVGVDDVAAWIDGLAAIRDRPDVADDSAAADRACAIAQFSWKATASAMATVYRTILGR